MLSTLGFCLYLAAQSFKNFCTLLGDKCVLFANVTTSVGSLYFLCSVGMRAGHQKGQGWIRAGGFQLRSPTSERWRRMRTELNRQWQGHVSHVCIFTPVKTSGNFCECLECRESLQGGYGDPPPFPVLWPMPDFYLFLPALHSLSQSLLVNESFSVNCPRTLMNLERGYAVTSGRALGLVTIVYGRAGLRA